MKVFQSLNCVLCNLPFARKVNEARSPRYLNCGLAVCDECFQKEKLLKGEERKHQCARKNCFRNSNFAFFLIDVLSQEDSLTLSPSGDGYVLAKPFNIPKCILCHDEYSNKIEQKKSRALCCGHLICIGCFMGGRKPNNDVVWPSSLRCPSCSHETGVVAEQKNRFQDFLDELPEMTLQLHEIQGRRACDGCEKMDSIDEMFYCIDCNAKICALCAFKSHRPHVATELLKEETHEKFDALHKDSMNVVKTYEDLFPGMCKAIVKDIGDFKGKLSSKEKNDAKKVLKFEDLPRKLEESTKLKADFGALAEELLPHLRRFETKVKGLIETLDKDLE